MNDILVEGIFHVGHTLTVVEQLDVVGFVLGKQQLRLAIRQEPPFAILPMGNLRTGPATPIRSFGCGWTAQVFTPRPGVAEPKRWQQVKISSLWSAIVGRDSDQNVFAIVLGVLDEDV